MSTDTGHSAAKPGTGPEAPRGAARRWKLGILGLVTVFVALACYDLISISGQNGPSGLAAAAGTASAPDRATPAGGGHSALSAPTSSSPVPATRAPSKAAAQVPHLLDVASVAAFGPDGLADGDNPGFVYRIDGDTEQPWYSQWYATPEFGNLRSGTGLLLDMGKTVSVRDVRLVLGSALGADVQARVGNAADLTDLAAVATATDAGGNVQLTAAAPAEGRYVLVWFTRLPPDGQGHFQISVYSATVDGTVGT